MFTMFLVFATQTVDPLLVIAGEILSAVMEGNWWIAVSSALALLAMVQRRFGERIWKPLASVPATIIGSFLFSFLGGVTNALAAGVAISWPVIAKALEIGFAAAGGWGALELLWRWVTGRDDDEPEPA